MIRPTYLWRVRLDGFYKLVRDGFEQVERPAHLLPLDQLRAMGDTAGAAPGIYFLWRGPQLLYIGASKNVAWRIGWHALKREGMQNPTGSEMPFDRATSFAMAMVPARVLERDYIHVYLPPYNCPTN